MAVMKVEEIYEQQIKPLSAVERLRLLAMIAGDLAAQPAEAQRPKRYDWMSVRGIAPELLGEEWVSRTRRAADEHREHQWRHEP